jgi:hypothetical protein
MSYEEVRGIVLTATMAILSLTLTLFAIIWSNCLI